MWTRSLSPIPCLAVFTHKWLLSGTGTGVTGKGCVLIPTNSQSNVLQIGTMCLGHANIRLSITNDRDRLKRKFSGMQFLGATPATAC